MIVLDLVTQTRDPFADEPFNLSEDQRVSRLSGTWGLLLATP